MWKVDGALSGRGGLEGAGSESRGAIVQQGYACRLRLGWVAWSHREPPSCAVTQARHVTGSGRRFPAWTSVPFQFQIMALQRGRGWGGDGRCPGLVASLLGLTVCGESLASGAVAIVFGAWRGDSWECRSRGSTAPAL